MRILTTHPRKHTLRMHSYHPDTHADNATGAMIARHQGSFHVMWKNSPFNEDSDGQRMLYASSHDGRVWSAATVLFPGLPAYLYNASMRKVHLQPAPFVTLNGRL